MILRQVRRIADCTPPIPPYMLIKVDISVLFSKIALNDKKVYSMGKVEISSCQHIGGN